MAEIIVIKLLKDIERGNFDILDEGAGPQKLDNVLSSESAQIERS
jgi:hypothetical protein